MSSRELYSKHKDLTHKAVESPWDDTAECTVTARTRALHETTVRIDTKKTPTLTTCRVDHNWTVCDMEGAMEQIF